MGVTVAMGNPFGKFDVTARFKPIDIIPIALVKPDNLINAFCIFIGARNNFVRRMIRNVTQVFHKFLMIHDLNISGHGSVQISEHIPMGFDLSVYVARYAVFRSHQ